MRENALLRASTFVAATLVWLTLGAPEAIAATQPAPIEVFQDFSSFSAATKATQTITFDKFETGTSLGNPALVETVIFQHSAAATFKTIGDPYIPVSTPNVLAPFRPDNTLELGDTTLAFQKTTHAAGLFLVIGQGSNQDTTWTSTVTATDAQNHSISVTVTFRSVIGEQQFIGFKSRFKITSIFFGPATMPGASTVVAIDNVQV